jgi:hypothetical protein
VLNLVSAGGLPAHCKYNDIITALEDFEVDRYDTTRFRESSVKKKGHGEKMKELF